MGGGLNQHQASSEHSNFHPYHHQGRGLSCQLFGSPPTLSRLRKARGGAGAGDWESSFRRSTSCRLASRFAFGNSPHVLEAEEKLLDGPP